MRRIALVILMGWMMTACGQIDLHHDLSEGDADEILVLLSSNGIEATKTKEVNQQRVTWKVAVPSRHATKARELLLHHNLPKKREVGLAEVYKEKGLIPSPDEQKARYILALKGEIINSLERIPNIIDADVVLNVPDQPAFAVDKVQRPTASVILRVRSGGEPIRDDKVQQFVANAVEGMDPRDVAVIVSYLGPSAATTQEAPGSATPLAAATAPAGASAGLIQVGGLKLDTASAKRFKLYAGLVLVLLILVSIGLVYAVFRLTRIKALTGGLPPGDRTLEGGIAGVLPAGGPQGGPGSPQAP